MEGAARAAVAADGDGSNTSLWCWPGAAETNDVLTDAVATKEATTNAAQCDATVCGMGGAEVAAEVEVARACGANKVNELAMLLANTSELLAALRTDDALISTSGAAQVTLTGCVQDTFAALLALTKLRYSSAVGSILEDGPSKKTKHQFIDPECARGH